MSDKKNILLISSLDPTNGVGSIAMDYYNALTENGFQVDFFTRMKVKGHPEILYALEKNPSKWSNISFRFVRRFRYISDDKSRLFFYRKETEPPVKINRILNRIQRNYDAIIIFFWQNLLSYESILKIYQYCHNKPKVIFLCADYSPMTGACHFFGDCENYKTGCGNCPMFNYKNKNDFTAKNVIFREKVIKKIKPYVLINTYMKSFYSESTVMQAGAIFKHISMTMDLNIFKPFDKNVCRQKFNIPKTSKFVILFGSQLMSEERKGMKYLVESLNILWDKLSDIERNQIHIVTIGKSSDIFDSIIKFERTDLGYLDFKTLPEVYSLADVFLSPSINDAGPSMVNQSIACGTPVIAFEMGTALDVIKNQGTGICVPLKDTHSFAEAIYTMFRKNPVEMDAISKQCRLIAEKYHSFKAFADTINEIIEQEN